MKNSRKNKLKKDWYYIKRVLPYFKKQKGVVFVFLFTSIVMSLISILFPILTKNIIDTITEANYEKTIILAVIILGATLLYSVISKYLGVAWTKLQNSLISDMQKDIASAVFELETSELHKKSSGLFIDRINRDPEKIFNAFNSIRNNVSQIITNVGINIYIFSLSWIIGLIIVLIQITIYIIEKEAIKKYVKKEKIINTLKEKSMGIINEGIRGSSDIKLLGLKRIFKQKIDKCLLKVFDEELSTNKIDSNYVLARSFVKAFAEFSLIIIGLILLKYNLFSISKLMVIIMYKDNLFGFVLYVAWSERHIKDFSLSAERIFNIIDNHGFRKEIFGLSNINKMTGKIEFKNVDFGYDKSKKVFNNLSFLIEPNDTVGIIGKSGVGKSTIFNLITKTFKKESGEILFDGVDIDKLNENSLRNNIAVISQTPYIFNMSIKENLLLASPDASKKQLENVLKATELYDFVQTLPHKINTKLGEGGVNLSGGQKQRLAIARALIKRTEIILFDEATSALDNETQKNIQDAISNISSEYTILIIAHRLSTIKNCNKIFVLDHGKIESVGTHEELMNNSAIYKELYDIELEK